MKYNTKLILFCIFVGLVVGISGIMARNDKGREVTLLPSESDIRAEIDCSDLKKAYIINTVRTSTLSTNTVSVEEYKPQIIKINPIDIQSTRR